MTDDLAKFLKSPAAKKGGATVNQSWVDISDGDAVLDGHFSIEDLKIIIAALEAAA